MERKKRLILEASIKLIVSEKGRLPTKLLAKRVGLSEGTVFRYFENKENLLKEIEAYILEDFRTYFKSAGLSWRKEENHFLDLNLPSQQRFRILWDVYLDWGTQHLSAFRALWLLGGGEALLSPFLEKQFRLLFHLKRLAFIQKHDKEPDAGLLDLYLNLAIHLFISVGTTTIEMTQEMPDKYAARQLREMSFAIFSSGLSASPLVAEKA